MFKGMIVFWYGTVALIPYGWHLCDGNEGTPRIYPHSPVGAGGSYAVGDEAHVFIHKHNAHAPHYHAAQGGPDIDYEAGHLFVSSTADPLITSDYTDHYPPFYAMLLIMKL